MHSPLSVAQESTSAALAAELAQILDARQMDSIAPRGTPPDEFIAALYFQGGQLLVVGGTYPVPERPIALIRQRDFRDVYIDLNSVADQQSKVFISDMAANGLRFDQEGSSALGYGRCRRSQVRV